MAVVKPNYKILKEEALKKKITFFKIDCQRKIRSDLKTVQNITFISDS